MLCFVTLVLICMCVMLCMMALPACEAKEDVHEEKREKFSRQMPRRKKPAAVGRGKSRRSKASSFDFGISKTVHR